MQDILAKSDAGVGIKGNDFAWHSGLRLTVPLVFVVIWLVVVYMLQQRHTASLWSITATLFTIQQHTITQVDLLDTVWTPVKVRTCRLRVTIVYC